MEVCDLLHSAKDWHFEKLIALGYYDGPTEGLFRRSDKAYVFKMVAIGADRDLRVITIGEIDDEEFMLTIATLESKLGSPRWPVWVPRWEFRSEAAQKVAEDAVNRAYHAATMVAVALCDETLRHCSAVRSIDKSQAADVTDWFAFVQAEGQ